MFFGDGAEGGARSVGRGVKSCIDVYFGELEAYCYDTPNTLERVEARHVLSRPAYQYAVEKHESKKIRRIKDEIVSCLIRTLVL